MWKKSVHAIFSYITRTIQRMTAEEIFYENDFGAFKFYNLSRQINTVNFLWHLDRNISQKLSKKCVFREALYFSMHLLDFRENSYLNTQKCSQC